MAEPEKSPVDSELVHRLARLLEETGLSELEYATDHWRIRVVRQPPAAAAAPAPAAAAALPAAAGTSGTVAPAPTDASHPGAVLSPMVGTVYLLPEPGAPPFVAVGKEVKAGETLLIIEAMKVMNPLPAPRAGRVAVILVENGAPVEYGAALMIIE
ncbi:MAG TPA: acetyl-CoA carboxylase biotin carboxyl carrier protein [Alphaproteobacteria bacterium]|nr:acetyl-CoA carboxylase biotin carboxyl carrier protein [Alphaproteobacteria bacterium]